MDRLNSGVIVAKEEEKSIILDSIMNSDVYQSYGYYLIKESYMREWRAHNFIHKFIDFDVKTGEEYAPYADDLNSYKRKYYSIVFYDNQIYVLSL